MAEVTGQEVSLEELQEAATVVTEAPEEDNDNNVTVEDDDGTDSQNEEYEIAIDSAVALGGGVGCVLAVLAAFATTF